jgi:cytochrome P450
VADLVSPSFKAEPHAFYARLRRQAPVVRTRLAFWIPVWLVTRYDDVVFVLRDPRFSKDFSEKIRWLTPPYVAALNRHLLNADPPDHKRLRALVSKAFTPRAIERLGGRAQQLCDELLRSVPASGEIELVADYALRLPLTLISDMIGVPPEDRGRFGHWARRTAAGSSLAFVDVVGAQPSLWQAVRYLRGLIAARRAAPQDDMTSALITAEEDGDHLTADEVLGMIALLLLAGFETTMSLISAGTLALLRHPAQRKRFVEEPELLDSAIEELLRYTSVADFATARIAREDVDVGGHTVPRGAVVLAVIGSANRDEARFPDPDVLDLARDPNPHLAFGSGPHFCLGAALARLEAGIALRALFARFPRLRLADPSAPVPYRRGLLFRGPEALQLRCS